MVADETISLGSPATSDVAIVIALVVDLDTGSQRKLTDFGREFIVTDFDVSADGSEIIFDRRRDNSDIVPIDRSGP